jgi:hypothetical protein
MARVDMAQSLRESTSNWVDCYHAALRRRRPRLVRRLGELAAELREPIDTALVLGIVFAAAVLLACAFPV